VISQLSVTLMTRKPLTAALELDRDDVALAMIMGASRLRIDIYSQDDCAANVAACC